VGIAGEETERAPRKPARVYILTPVYFDVDPLLTLREDAARSIEEDPDLRGTEVTFVALDDTAGRDPEFTKVRSLADATVITPPFNLGHQRGLVYALRCLAPTLRDSDLIVTMDADGEDRPTDVPRLIHELVSLGENSEHLVVAQRTRRSKMPLTLRLLYPCFRATFYLATGTSVRSGNFAAYRADTAKRMLLHPMFDLCYSSTLLNLDFPVALVPCERGDRISGKSRMGYSQLFSHALRMLMPFTENIARRALWTFLVSLVIAVILALTIVAVRLGTESATPGWATYSLAGMSILSVVSLGNLVLLFTVYSQSTAVSLSSLESNWDPFEARPVSERER